MVSNWPNDTLRTYAGGAVRCKSLCLASFGVWSDAVLHPPKVTRNTPVLSRMPWAGGRKILMDDW